MSQNMINLTCPTCGGKLDIPDNLSVAHCMYCGAKILISESESHKDQLKLNSYLDICESAFKAKNYQETLDYCNKILEIDTKIFDAWIYKARATFWLTTGAYNRYDEAISYLDEAKQIDPVNPRIGEVKEELAKLQAWWLCRLGNDAAKNALEIFKIYKSTDIFAARENSKEKYIEAANYFFQATHYDSDNMDALSWISVFVNSFNWISWNDEFRKKAQIYDNYKKKQEELEKKKQTLEKHKEEIEKLPKYREALEKAEINLSNIKQEKGFFAGKKVKEAEDRVKQLKDYITYLEKLKGWDDL